MRNLTLTSHNGDTLELSAHSEGGTGYLWLTVDGQTFGFPLTADHGRELSTALRTEAWHKHSGDVKVITGADRSVVREGRQYLDPAATYEAYVQVGKRDEYQIYAVLTGKAALEGLQHSADVTKLLFRRV